MRQLKQYFEKRPLMILSFRFCWLAGLLFCLFSCGDTTTDLRNEQRILLVTASKNLRSATTESPWTKLQDWSTAQTISIDTASHMDILREDSLARYSTVMLFDLDLNDLQPWHHSDLERYVQAGGGLMAMNCKSPLAYGWHWYQQAQKQSAGDSPFQQLDYDGGRVMLAAVDSTDWKGGGWEAALEQSLVFGIGENRYDLSKAHSPRAPHFNRFTKLVLDDDINEPMELAVLPNNKVIFIERRGLMKMYDPNTNATSVISTFDVCTEGNYEDGLLGLALDPAYGKENNWLYLYYSPPCAEPHQYLSRFEFSNDTISRASEVVMLKVLVQRETCCHSGGSVAFGPDGLLYLSTGDNTSSKESDGFTPTDERPGRGPFDAQKSSGNTHDLRGKILRIQPLADGTYAIPEGNLFPADGSGGRPEIYVMGARNPFRISVDAETNYVYWGDVGPDGGADGRYGPQSYDEWNQARSAGNYGWPYFVADNKGYPYRDFNTGAVGALPDPARPVNRSPYNTGDSILPPARPAMIWYPYGASPEFPLLGEGSRSSMAGPVYRRQLTYSKFVRFPEYYEGKLFIYEWARSWVKVLEMDSIGNLVQMEDFMPDTEFVKPIEMEFGPDGALYVLEYGNQYFLNNPEAKLSRIEFSAFNRAPVARMLVDQTEGAAPHRIQCDASASFDHDDGDGNALRYEWFFTGASQPEAEGKTAEFTFEKNGVYDVTLRVIDSNGASETTTTQVRVGNAPPKVELACQGNQTFYFPSQPLRYEVQIDDKENTNPDLSAASVSLSFLGDPEYVNALRSGKADLPEGPLNYIAGKQQIDQSDCRTCHHEVNPSIGPTYTQVALRYQDRYDAVEYLSEKVIKGGNGNWGKSMMAAHPQLSKEQASEMIRYILSLSGNDLLPLTGELTFDDHFDSPGGGYLLAASFQDEGANGIGPLSGRATRLLRSPQVQVEHCDERKEVWVSRFGSGLTQTQAAAFHEGFLKFAQIDLNGIDRLSVRVKPRRGGRIDIRLDQPNGPTVGSISIASGPSGKQERRWQESGTKLNPTKGIHDLYLVFVDPGGGQQGVLFDLDWMRFIPQSGLISSLK